MKKSFVSFAKLKTRGNGTKPRREQTPKADDVIGKKTTWLHADEQEQPL